MEITDILACLELQQINRGSSRTFLFQKEFGMDPKFLYQVGTLAVLAFFAVGITYIIIGITPLSPTPVTFFIVFAVVMVAERLVINRMAKRHRSLAKTT